MLVHANRLSVLSEYHKSAATATDGERIGFTGLEKAEPIALVLEGKSPRGLRSYPTKMFNLVTEIPLKQVQKQIIKVTDTSREAFRLLKALFVCEPHARAVVALGSRKKMEELAQAWERDFQIVWMHSGIGPEKNSLLWLCTCPRSHVTSPSLDTGKNRKNNSEERSMPGK
ncbi:hypothetical protein HG536_0D06200 [Torulaspora globosa]|uniref:Uncharacterized protein n=1 Tax=Torulaspora globosa TaxID=48254 RepID=A0A7G3ZHW1_9SACH|nr:uncharacterized protein HG536_0D06200 [Torulaspora globosa]QLL33097.1 hypothetical protein HG536_0D06200 [Torulaspora globosa]